MHRKGNTNDSETFCDSKISSSIKRRMQFKMTMRRHFFLLSKNKKVDHTMSWQRCLGTNSFVLPVGTLYEELFGHQSVSQFSHPVVSDSLRPHELQHARPSCASPTPRVQQTHVHWVGDTTQTSHPLSSPSPPALNVSQHQGLFQWVNYLHEVAIFTKITDVILTLSFYF